MKNSSNSTGTPGGVLQTDTQEVASVVSAREIQAVAELLQVSPEGLQKAITFKVTVSPWWLGPLHAPCCVGPLPLSPASHSCPSLGCAQSWVPQTPKALQPPGLCIAVPVFIPTQPPRPNIDIACSREPPLTPGWACPLSQPLPILPSRG